MTTSVQRPHLSRRAILKGGALTVSFALAGVASDLFAQSPGAASRVLDPKEVDAFLTTRKGPLP